MRLVDRRFAGIARGVGTAKILGRVHSAQIKLSDLYLPCSFTIMEVRPSISTHRRLLRASQGRDVDLLLGLDMLKAHQACIDLRKNVLRIQDREVQFLSEHELPPQARNIESGDDARETSVAGTSASAGLAATERQGPSFPGTGHSLGATPPNRGPSSSGPETQHSQYPESAIRILMDLGATRDMAISTLDAAGGNVDVAASLLF